MYINFKRQVDKKRLRCASETGVVETVYKLVVAYAESYQCTATSMFEVAGENIIVLVELPLSKQSLDIKYFIDGSCLIDTQNKQ